MNDSVNNLTIKVIENSMDNINNNNNNNVVDSNRQNLLVSPVSPSISFNAETLDANSNRNQLNQSALSQPSSYQTGNIIPSTNNNTLTYNPNIEYFDNYTEISNENVKKSNNRKSPGKYSTDSDHETMGHSLRAKSIIEYNRRKEELQQFYQKLLRMINDSINIIKAVVMRLVFSLHSIIAISYVYIVKRDEWYFVNVVGVVFLLIELFITIIKRRGHEPSGYL